MAQLTDADLGCHTISVQTFRLTDGLTNMLRVLDKTIALLTLTDLWLTAVAVNAVLSALRIAAVVGPH